MTMSVRFPLGILVGWRVPLLVCMVLCGHVACSVHPTVTLRGQTRPAQQVEPGTWADGISAFQEGDYARALLIFEELNEHAKTESVSRKALFGQAVTRFMLARTPEEYGEAMSFWEFWSRRAQTAPDTEDPLLLTLFLERLTSRIVAESARNKALSSQEAPANNVSPYKSLFQGKEKEVEQLKAKLEAKEKENRRLKHQINSLEEIHLKFQEKKQEVSSP